MHLMKKVFFLEAVLIAHDESGRFSLVPGLHVSIAKLLSKAQLPNFYILIEWPSNMKVACKPKR